MLSICIPTKNRLGFLKICLDSFKTLDIPFEILIADGSSTDGTIEYLDSLDNVTVFKNTGAVEGINLCYKNSKEDYVCSINDDMVMDVGVVEKCCRFLESHPSFGLMSLKMVETKYNNYPNVDMHYSGFVLGKIHIFRKDVLEDIGFCDSFFKKYFIDVDCVLNVLSRGYKIACSRGVGVVHFRSHTGRQTVTDFHNKEFEYLKNKWKDLPVKRRNSFMYLVWKSLHFRGLQFLMYRQVRWFMVLYDIFLEGCSSFLCDDMTDDFYLIQKIGKEEL